MTKQRFGRTAKRAAIEDEALAQIAGRAPRSPRNLGWLEIVGAGLWLCVLGMITLATLTMLA